MGSEAINLEEGKARVLYPSHSPICRHLSNEILFKREAFLALKLQLPDPSWWGQWTPCVNERNRLINYRARQAHRHKPLLRSNM